MYTEHFRLSQRPFSIAPDPTFVYLTARHRDALAHLLFGLEEGGGFVQLTGEVGTGKTTVCRTLLRQLPEHVDVALVFNPPQTVPELLLALCEELHIEPPPEPCSIKALVDRIYAYLLDANARGRRTVLIIDEAQNLGADVLEELRLLTNLETDDAKLLQIFLIGQPELRKMLASEGLRQVAQRITARCHLEPLTRRETERYIEHRLSVAGSTRRLFTRRAVREVHHLARGIPRLINILCDRALLGAYATDRDRVTVGIVRKAAAELRGERELRPVPVARYAGLGVAALGLALVGIAALDRFGVLSRFEIDALARVGDAVRAVVPLDRTEAPPTVVAESAGIAARAPRAATGEPLASAPVGEPSPATRSAGTGAPAPPSADTPAPASETVARASGGPAARADASRAEPSPPPLREVLLATGGEEETRRAAVRALASLWGEPAPDPGEDLCAWAARHALACFGRSGSWSQLRGFDLPALLTLRLPEAGARTVALGALTTRDATVQLAQGPRVVALSELDRFWTGEFMLVWRPPLDGAVLIAPWHSGPTVGWLRRILARIDGIDSIPDNPEVFDAALVARVKAFQRRHGLDPDGLVGPETLMHLSSLSDEPSLPRLDATRPRAAMAAVSDDAR